MSERYLRHKSVPVYDDDDAVEDEIDGKRTYDIKEKLESSKYDGEFLIDLKGHELTFERIQRYGLSDPLRIKDPDGLGMVMPDRSTFSVSDVRAFVGGRRMVDVMECKTQRALEMSMRDFERYFEGSDRKYIYNVISLEFSQSRLESLIQRPKVVDALDWIDLVWPQHLKHTQVEQTNRIHHMKYPKVQKYCLMSVAGCYTDFHIDFGGTSVWYHILKGGKIFWLIPPTNENLQLYERWTLSGNQGDIFFADMVSRAQRLELVAGNSLMIPSGWIHAVYTPYDSIVFGGNFLNSFNIPMQLRIAQVEERLKVPGRFRFPFFSEVLWYALDRYLHCLTKKTFLSEEFKEENHCIVKEKPDVEKEEEEYVHLTPFEYKGLQKLIETLEFLPEGKQSIPDGILNPLELIKTGKSLLWNHSADDHEMSITGKSKVYWPVTIKPRDLHKLTRKPRTPSTSSTPGTKKPNASRVRRVRCKQCEACQRGDCRECVFCKDMRKYGGPGTMKQTCILRRCINPILPSTAREEPVTVNQPTPFVESPVPPKPGKRGKKRLSSNESVVVPMKSTKLEEDVEEEDDDSDFSPPSKNQMPRVVIARVSTGDLAKYAVRPADSSTEEDLAKLPTETETLSMNRTLWMHVFKYLNHTDLCSCMLVCKDFLRWCASPSLWKSVNLTGKQINSSTLQCLVRRTPTSINFSESNISYRQLMWLFERSPSLRELYLIRCAWSTVAALNTAACPPLNLLDLSWAAGFTDPHLKQLLSAPTDVRPGQEICHTRLRFCRELSVAGTDITDVGLKLISHYLPHLKSVNISFCSVTSEGFGYLTSSNSSMPKILSVIISQHCHLMTDCALQNASKLPKISQLDFRGCTEVTEEACEDFIENFKLNLFMPEPLYLVAQNT
uniref:[histone H3]-dimethyl-L-lysine(36) demethylase n=2 Tax=Ciona intestinalis TaxID=7719 RepID=Q1RQ05_CIOIN|nr:zinc finger protein [Ciona intestinalis]BAE93280.1 zinc finger protein [Ciona intestinalis]|eukprot:NP_001071898.1 zinc finger protein [Ciona intestinalis]